MDDPNLSSYFQVFQSLYQFFGDCSEHTDYNWYHRFIVCFLNSLTKSKYLFFFSLSFIFTVACRDSKVYYSAGSLSLSFFFFFFFFFFFWLSLGLVVWPRLGDLFVSQNPRELNTSHSPGLVLGFVHMPLVRLLYTYLLNIYNLIWLDF